MEFEKYANYRIAKNRERGDLSRTRAGDLNTENNMRNYVTELKNTYKTNHTITFERDLKRGTFILL